MEKKYSSRNVLGNFHDTVGAMLRCRKYLEKQGFNEYILRWDEGFYYDNYNAISGTINFPDGSVVDQDNFVSIKSTIDRNSLLERIISKNAVFKRYPINIHSYNREKVLRTSFNGRDYDFKLSVTDVTRDSVIIPIRWFLIKPKHFGIQYDISLKKPVINDIDLKEFEKHVTGLKLVVNDFTLKNDEKEKIEDKVEDEQVGNDNPAEKIINPRDYNPRQIEERMIYDGGSRE